LPQGEDLPRASQKVSTAQIITHYPPPQAAAWSAAEDVSPRLPV